MAMWTLYDILGISQTATNEEIKEAFRRQAMKWHPDRNLNNRAEAEKRFKEIAYAFRVLSNPQQRAEYDAHLASQYRTGAKQEEKAGFDAGVSDDDAASIFFEQILELAFDLARKGFGEEKILKMLLAIDCPEGIAKAVAKVVVQNTRSTGNPSNYSSPPPNHAPDSSGSIRWEEIAPYYAAAIGGAQTSEEAQYYMSVFEGYHRARSQPFKMNWGAFVFSCLWIAYRRMPIPALILAFSVMFVYEILSRSVEYDHRTKYDWIFYAVQATIMGMVGNRIYFNSVRRRINEALALPKEQALASLRKKGGTSWATLIYTLILFYGIIGVLLIMGIAS